MLEKSTSNLVNDLAWLADDAAPRGDGIYGEYRAWLNKLAAQEREMTKEGEIRFQEALQHCNSIRRQIVAQEGQV